MSLRYLIPQGLLPNNHHVGRYQFAATRAHGPTLDAACGQGYGTQILAKKTGIAIGLDILERNILMAARYFNDGPTAFICADIMDEEWRGNLDGIETVVSLETIEHTPSPEEVVKVFFDLLPSGGHLISSVPNEHYYPFIAEEHASDPYPHLRHYDEFDFLDLIEGAGFRSEEMWSQHGKMIYNEQGKRINKTVDTQPVKDAHGLFLLNVAVKP